MKRSGALKLLVAFSILFASPILSPWASAWQEQSDDDRWFVYIQKHANQFRALHTTKEDKPESAKLPDFTELTRQVDRRDVSWVQIPRASRLLFSFFASVIDDPKYQSEAIQYLGKLAKKNPECAHSNSIRPLRNELRKTFETYYSLKVGEFRRKQLSDLFAAILRTLSILDKKALEESLAVLDEMEASWKMGESWTSKHKDNISRVIEDAIAADSMVRERDRAKEEFRRREGGEVQARGYDLVDAVADFLSNLNANLSEPKAQELVQKLAAGRSSP